MITMRGLKENYVSNFYFFFFFFQKKNLFQNKKSGNISNGLLLLKIYTRIRVNSCFKIKIISILINFLPDKNVHSL